MRNGALIGMTFSILMMTGCKEKTSERRYDTRKGTAKAIDVETGEVTLEITTTKGEKREIPGWVTQETEIVINGKVAKLEEIKPMEEVTVVGYIEGEKLNKRYVATRVEVERAEELTLGGGGDQASSKPSADAKEEGVKEEIAKPEEKTPEPK